MVGVYGNYLSNLSVQVCERGRQIVKEATQCGPVDCVRAQVALQPAKRS